MRKSSSPNTKTYRRPWGYERLARCRSRRCPLTGASGWPRSNWATPKNRPAREATRCLHCWENTIFNEGGEETGSECILCGGCVDICPENCIDLVSLDRSIRSEPALATEPRSNTTCVLAGGMKRRIGSVMIKDEHICIRCGLCASAGGMITMEDPSALRWKDIGVEWTTEDKKSPTAASSRHSHGGIFSS